MSRCRNYCFTAYCDDLKIQPDPVIRYYVYQQEVCPSTGRKHYQGYIEFHKAMRNNSIAKIIGTHKAKFLPRLGTAKQASDYCKKKESAIPNTLVEWGEMSKQGERKDIDEVVRDIQEGKSDESHDIFIMRYPNGYRSLVEKYDIPQARPNIKITYIYGPPGTGKSHTAYELCKEAYRLDDSSPVWFDGYRGQKCIVIEEFKGLIPICSLLKLCDKYPLRMPVKGGFVSIKADHIIFTSNFRHDALYQDSGQHDAWIRRIKEFGNVLVKNVVYNKVN